MSYELPILYQKSSTGKIKMWQISVQEPATIITIHGFTDGKKQEDRKEIKEGKNIGKSNETTPYQQACNDAQGKWNKKKDREGYSENENVESETASFISPMLAYEYSKRKHDIVYPALMQPKLNGLRCIVTVENDQVIYQSRRGKIWTTLSHLDKEMKHIYALIGKPLDGEIYIHGTDIQDINALVKKFRSNENKIAGYITSNLEYHIYDFVDSEKNFKERNRILGDIFLDNDELANAVYVQTVELHSDELIDQLHKELVSMGYEGSIIRNNVPYVIGHRTKHLLKKKDFIDSEFEIIGGVSGTGREEGAVIFKCKTINEQEFDVRPKGSIEQRKEWLTNINSLIGRMLNCQYREITKDGLPFHCVGIYIRDIN